MIKSFFKTGIGIATTFMSITFLTSCSNSSLSTDIINGSDMSIKESILNLEIVQADKISLATVFDTVVVHNNQYWELKTRSVEYLGNGSKNISTVTYKHNYDYSNLPVLAENTIMLDFDCGVNRSDSLYDNMGRLIKVCDYMNYSYNRDTIFYVDDIKVKLYVPTEDNWTLSAQTIFEYENNLLKFKKQCVIDNGTINSHEYTSTTYSYKDDKIVCQLDSQFFDDGSFMVFNKIDYDYYPSGRLESVTYYDYTAENPIEKDIYTYDYDGNKCLSKSVLSISYKDGMFVGNNIEREEYKYDKNGNTTNITTNEGEIALGKYNTTDVKTLLSLGIGAEENRKNAIQVNIDGEIFIITDIKTGSIESLQTIIQRNSISICLSYDEMLEYCVLDLVSKLLYLRNDSLYNDVEYKSGLYMVCLDAQTNAPVIVNIGSSVEADLSNYYTKEEINQIIDKVNAGEVTLLDYYNKNEIDTTVKKIEDRLDTIEDFIENPIQTKELEIITQIDLDNDNKIG
jgi:hypothetical protein